MDWHASRAAARHRHAARYDAIEAGTYASQHGLGWLKQEEELAYLDDLARVVTWRSGLRVLDAGAGTGTLAGLLRRVPGLELRALEPSAAMLDVLRRRVGFECVHAVLGSCDQPCDARHFAAASFDVIAARQVVNGLFDPLVAFRNWHHWLEPDGRVVVIEGTYGRGDWRDAWEEEVDVLPLSATQSLATVPYLLEAAGFEIVAVDWMTAVNALPSTRTRRYMVVARPAAVTHARSGSTRKEAP